MAHLTTTAAGPVWNGYSAEEAKALTEPALRASSLAQAALLRLELAARPGRSRSKRAQAEQQRAARFALSLLPGLACPRLP